MNKSSLDYDVTELEPEDEAMPSTGYEIFSYPADTTLKGYLEQWYNNQLTVPEFQRDYVWDQTRASKLVESFLLGLPVPPVFLYKPAGSKSFWIIDGHQRIRSVVDYQKGLFGESKFRLKGVDDKWLGKTIDDLSDDERFNFETAVLRAVVIQQTQPKDHSSIYHIFERLNTGGIRLNAMEVRQCVYASDFLTKLKDLNLDSNWRAILGIEKVDKRLKDKELLLRVIAFYNDLEHYDKPMKKFLNDCAIFYKETSENDRDKYEELITDISARFIGACELIKTDLGDRPFHLKGRLNYSALDAVVATLMRNNTVEDIKEKYAALVADVKFQDAVSFNTSDESVVERRFELTSKYFS